MVSCAVLALGASFDLLDGLEQHGDSQFGAGGELLGGDAGLVCSHVASALQLIPTRMRDSNRATSVTRSSVFELEVSSSTSATSQYVDSVSSKASIRDCSGSWALSPDTFCHFKINASVKGSVASSRQT